jgi:UDP-3-O-[3-hydroxymyristoyl] glucosamine N-acyltransferase
LLRACDGESAADPTTMFAGIAALDAAGAGDVSYLERRRYLPRLKATRASAVIVTKDHAAAVPEGVIAILAAQPALAFARIAALFHPAPMARPGLHPTAVIAADAALGPGVEVGPFAVIGARAVIGAHSAIGPHAVVGENVVLGEYCRLHAHASISHAICGDRVVLHPGARVGQEGYSFTPAPDGSYVTMPQLGIVRLGEAVEIGANSCVDRGALADTVLGPGTRLDNLVQIGHNVTTGRGCVFVAQAGISGSTTIGDYVTFGGQSGSAGHLEVGSGARIAAQSGVIGDVPPGQDYAGSPAMPAKSVFRAIATLRRLSEKSPGDKR